MHRITLRGGVIIALVIAAGLFLWIAKMGWPVLNREKNTPPGTEKTSEQPASVEKGENTQQQEPSIRSINVELFQYGYAPDPLVITAGETVRIRFSSRDVAHSFSMGDEGFEEWNVYVEPGKPVERTFRVPDLPGTYTVACDVFCGKGHSDMHGLVRIQPAL